MLFIEDQNLNRVIEITQFQHFKHAAWRLAYQMLQSRNLRWEYFF